MNKTKAPEISNTWSTQPKILSYSIPDLKLRSKMQKSRKYRLVSQMQIFSRRSNLPHSAMMEKIRPTVGDGRDLLNRLMKRLPKQNDRKPYEFSTKKNQRRGQDYRGTHIQMDRLWHGIGTRMKLAVEPYDTTHKETPDQSFRTSTRRAGVCFHARGLGFFISRRAPPPKIRTRHRVESFS